MVTSLGVGAHLEHWGVRPERIVELDWWESHHLQASDVTITAAPAQHYSGRTLKDGNATLWSSMVIRSRNHAVFFSGDTGLTMAYEAIRETLGPFDLVMLEAGAYHPGWGDIHLGPTMPLKRMACSRCTDACALGYVRTGHACMGLSGGETLGVIARGERATANTATG